MPSHREIARHFGCVKSYVDKLCRRGMPTHSYAAADAWRDANARKRPPTHHKTIAKQIEEPEEDPAITRERRAEYPPPTTNLVDNGRQLVDQDLSSALTHAIELEGEAYRMARDAMQLGQESKIQVRLAIHAKAQENRIKIESMIREERERRKDLISYDVATDIFRRGLDIILRRLKRFPQEKAPAVNPQNPLHALGILESGIDSIITEAQGQYASTG
jgi:hypothetical protein